MRWLVATVAETIVETARTTTLRLDVPLWPGHRAGQHVDVRLTAEDGYQAQRSYSIASPPGAERLELTVVRIDDGEVSPYLTTVADAGDQFEVRGPIGGWFVWEAADTRPVLLVGGGSGVVPLVAMMRHHANLASTAAMQLVYSARTRDDVIYREELQALADSGHRAVTLTFTREESPAWTGRRGRVGTDLLDEVGWPPTVRPHCYVCGPTPFVEAVASALVELGHEPAEVKTERFGPTGDRDEPSPPRRQRHRRRTGRGFPHSTSRRPITTCATCHHTHPIATLHAYVQAPGMVLRCASCDAVQLRLVRSPNQAWLDLRGIDMLDIPGP